MVHPGTYKDDAHDDVPFDEASAQGASDDKNNVKLERFVYDRRIGVEDRKASATSSGHIDTLH